MKCPKCGAEVESQRFCIYCGERLQAKDSSVHVQKTRTHSGVIRMKRHAQISQSELPEISSRQHESGHMKLASLQTASADVQRDSEHQSRELEALLMKLNGNDDAFGGLNDGVISSENRKSDADDSENEMIDESSEEIMQGSREFPSIDVSMGGDYSESGSLDNSFFDKSLSESEADISGPIPIGSGTFARTPSGGFNLLVDTVKSAYHRASKRVKNLFAKKQTDSNEAATKSIAEMNASETRKRRFIAGAIAAAVVLTVFAVILSSSGNNVQELQAAAQAPTGGNDNFAIVPIEDENTQDITTITFDDDDFSIPEFEAHEGEPDIELPSKADIEAARNAAESAASAAAKNDSPEPKSAGNTAKFTEKRVYGRTDNVYAGTSSAENFKTKKSCVMREGPASRFGLVKNVSAGTSMKILASTDEDWVLEVGSVWKKGGRTSKLGPGSQFADASDGMKIPQPKTRVISSKGWRYVQIGKEYGYIGPACFK